MDQQDSEENREAPVSKAVDPSGTMLSNSNSASMDAVQGMHGQRLDSPKKKGGLISRFRARNFFTKSSMDLDTVDGQLEKPDAKTQAKRGLFSKEGRSRSFPNLLQMLSSKTSNGADASQANADQESAVQYTDQTSPGKATTRRTKSDLRTRKQKRLEPLSIGDAISPEKSPAELTPLVNQSFLSALSDSPPSESVHCQPLRALGVSASSPVTSQTTNSPDLMSPKDLSRSFSSASPSPVPEIIISKPLDGNGVDLIAAGKGKLDQEGPARVNSVGGKSGKQSWVNSVTVFLYEGKDLPAMDRNGFSDPFCKFKLGGEKHRSRTAYKTLNPVWMEQFDMFIYSAKDTRLDIGVWDWDRGVRNDYIGHAAVDLATLESEKLHDLWLNIDDGNGAHCGSLHLSIMISGTKLLVNGSPKTLSTADRVDSNPNVLERYDVRHSFQDVKDVGLLTVKVFRASALRAADLNGKSDPYCVLRLVNLRKQTEVEHKTLDPEWNREFKFPVRDIHSVLEITVLDMDQDKKADFLGRIAIPLLNIRHGERRWYALKDEQLMGRAKGSLLLEMDVVFNHLRAAVRTINPRETRFDQMEPKFSRQQFGKNMTRIRNIIQPLVELAQYIQSCFNWESRRRSIIAFFVYMISVYCFDIWLLPVVILVFLIKHWIKQDPIPPTYGRDLHVEEIAEYEEETKFDDDDDLEDDPNRPSTNVTKSNNLVQKIKAAQEQLRTVQNYLGAIASLCERMYNTVHFTVPWLSYFAICILTVVTIILYFIPVRVILLIWGVHKFTKKLRNPNALGNNELLDFFSRVHTHEESCQYKELRPRDVPAIEISQTEDVKVPRPRTRNKSTHSTGGV